jgi:hypothetical protein
MNTSQYQIAGWQEYISLSLLLFSGSSLSSHPLFPCPTLLLVMVIHILALFFILHVSLSPVLSPRFFHFPTVVDTLVYCFLQNIRLIHLI